MDLRSQIQNRAPAVGTEPRDTLHLLDADDLDHADWICQWRRWQERQQRVSRVRVDPAARLLHTEVQAGTELPHRGGGTLYGRVLRYALSLWVPARLGS